MAARAEEETRNAAADMRAAAALWRDEGAAALRTASRRSRGTKARSHHHQRSVETGEMSSSHEYGGLTPRSGQIRGGFSNGNNMYDASRATESLSRADVKFDDNGEDEDHDEDWRGSSGKDGFAPNESLTESLRRSKALLQTSSAPSPKGGLDFLEHLNDRHDGGGNPSMTSKERSQKNSVVLSHTVNEKGSRSFLFLPVLSRIGNSPIYPPYQPLPVFALFICFIPVYFGRCISGWRSIQR